MVFRAFLDAVAILGFAVILASIFIGTIAIIIEYTYTILPLAFFCLIWYLAWRDRKYPPPKNGGKTG